MAFEFDSASQWDRVASELRAHRESQQRAWGDIDNATLGRYLANEADSDERQEVEAALNELPELRKLTELVRDVLGDSEPTAQQTPAPVLPATVPFPQRRPAPRRLFLTRQRASLVAAACLLMGIGLAVSSSSLTSLSPGEAPNVRLADGYAMARSEKEKSFTLGISDDVALEKLGALDDKVIALEKEGKVKEALVVAQDFSNLARHAPLKDQKVAARYAAGMNRAGRLFQQEGDFDHAEKSFSQAHTVCQTVWGPNHPETVQSMNGLAEVYQLALNSVAEDKDPYATRAYILISPLREAAMALPDGQLDLRSNPKSFHAKKDSAKDTSRDQNASVVALRTHITQQDARSVKRSVVPILVRAYKRAQKAEDRATFARALGELGPVACEAIPDLADGFKKAESDDERQAVLSSLTQMGPYVNKEVGQVFLSALNGENAESRESAEQILGQTGYTVRTAYKERANLTEAETDKLAHDILHHIQRIGVKDEVELFKPLALVQSQRLIVDLARTNGVEIFVETVSVLPGAKEKQIADRAAELGTDGVYVIFARDPASVQFHLSPRLRELGLVIDDARFHERIKPDLTRRDYDQALTKGIRFLIDALKKQADLLKKNS
jgi:hypothetical protein